MKKAKLCCAIGIYICTIGAYAQQQKLETDLEELQLSDKDSIVLSSWMVGVGINIVDDSGNVFNGLFNISQEWNMLPYPSRISIGKYFKNGLGLEAIGALNRYKKGNIIDGQVNPEAINYSSIDARITYDLNKIIGETGWFDPYVGVGAGYTNASRLGRGTYNAIVGFRTWFSDHWGLDFNSSGKWAMSQDKGATNHLQHAAGLVYRFGMQKGLSKKGEEKLALLAAIEEERQRQQDSILEARRLEEESLLAEKLRKEKEAAQLAAAKKLEEEAWNKQKQDIIDQINALGLVYFDLNSSVLTKNSKEILSSMAAIMQEHPSLKLQISSYTDSRGTAAYNDWLSQRRVDKTKEYMVSTGIAADRLQTQAFGETHLLNECDDHTYCPEAKHKINRRSEFLVIEF